MDIKIKEKLDNLFNYISNALSSIYSRKDEKDYHDFISSINGRLICMADILDESEEFEREYYTFLKIKKMIYYVLENIESINREDCLRVFDSFSKFNLLILLKFNYLDGGISQEEYQTKFDDFTLYLREFREYFYLNVYEKDGRFDALINEVSYIFVN